MQEYWIWWGCAALLGILELLTGTFYLLMLAIGAAAGGVAAFGGAGVGAQLALAAAGTVGGWLALRRLAARPSRGRTSANRDVHLDVGERVRVERWEAGGRTEVRYRGANWAAELAADDAAPPEPGEYVIRRVEGNRLVLGRAR